MTEALVIAVVVQALVIAALSASVPALWWKAFRLSSRLAAANTKIAKLDEAVTGLLEFAGIKDVAAAQAGNPHRRPFPDEVGHWKGEHPRKHSITGEIQDNGR